MTLTNPFEAGQKAFDPFAKDATINDNNDLRKDDINRDTNPPPTTILSPHVNSPTETDSNLISNPDPLAGSSPNFINPSDITDPHNGVKEGPKISPPVDLTIPQQSDQHKIPGKLSQAAIMADDSKYVKTDSALATRAEILAEHGGLESNIPINSKYWQLKY